MNRLALAGAKSRRLFTRQVLFVGLAVCIVWYLAVQYRGDVQQRWSELELPEAPVRTPPRRMPTDNVLPELAKRGACYGPRGRLLGESPDDDLVSRELDGRK
jgi:hypothetical protein